MIAKPPPNGDDVSPEITAALQHTRRSAVAEKLLEHDGELSLVTLASRLAAERDEKLPNVVVEFHNVHLPELVDCGLVEYDSDTGVVRLVADSDVVEAALADVRDAR
ncbi:hypothetical protein ACFQJD_14495 [Haloplanus sp. GCM10025708]|uniref:DUF7344 domain-containing protein n=1 Tax=Haloferacaceae TaxID=1644056 RepID=UPI0036164A5D